MSGRDNGEEIGSKRPLDGGGDYGGAKRWRSSRTTSGSSGGNRTELRLLIPTACAGAVIGKGGSNIRELREKYNASVQIPDSHAAERVVNTSTFNHDDASALCGRIVDYVNSEHSDSKEQEVRVLIHKSQAGSIIGSKGARIKELRESTGALIKVFQDCCPESTDRICQVRGENDVIVRTVKRMLELLETTPPKGHVQPYDPNCMRMGGMFEYGGFMGDEGGRFGRGPRGGRDSFGDGRRGFGGRPPRGRGGFGSLGSGGFGGGGGPSRGRNFYDGGNDFKSDSFGGGFGNFRQSGNSLQDFGGGPETTTKVTIPTALAGSIIGRGGQRIRQIRQDCGAQIKIEQAEPGSDDRIITITGNQEQIQNAQFLLQKSVKLYSGGKY